MTFFVFPEAIMGNYGQLYSFLCYCLLNFYVLCDCRICQEYAFCLYFMIEVVNLTLVDRHEAYSNWGATLTTSYTMRTRGRVTLNEQSLPDMRQQLLRAAISMLRDASQNNQNTWQQNQQESSGLKVPSWSVCTRKGRSLPIRPSISWVTKQDYCAELTQHPP